MTSTMYIGSGDVTALLAGLNTKAHHNLLKRFVSGVKPYYNAKNSPIDALRTGAILEDRYFLTLPDGYYSQFSVVSEKMSVLKSSLDFAKLEGGKVVDFDELKTCSFNDFLKFEDFRHNNAGGVEYIKKNYKDNYNQFQQQLYTTGLGEANIVFLVVYSYEDNENYNREIQPNEWIKFRVSRDEDVISRIEKRSDIFQQIKNTYDDK